VAKYVQKKLQNNFLKMSRKKKEGKIKNHIFSQPNQEQFIAFHYSWPNVPQARIVLAAR
jgi:hypothetical protein